MVRRPPNDGAGWSAKELKTLGGLAKSGELQIFTGVTTTRQCLGAQSRRDRDPGLATCFAAGRRRSGGASAREARDDALFQRIALVSRHRRDYLLSRQWSASPLRYKNPA
jgi:hypothetical protein